MLKLCDNRLLLSLQHIPQMPERMLNTERLPPLVTRRSLYIIHVRTSKHFIKPSQAHTHTRTLSTHSTWSVPLLHFVVILLQLLFPSIGCVISYSIGAPRQIPRIPSNLIITLRQVICRCLLRKRGSM